MRVKLGHSSINESGEQCYKAIISYYNFKQTGNSHTKTVAVKSLHSAEFLTFVRVEAERWLDLIQDWLFYSTDCYVIMYEVSKKSGVGIGLGPFLVVIYFSGGNFGSLSF